MLELWNILLLQPLVSLLAALFQVFGNLGLAIVALTVVLRVVLIPLVLPSMRAQKKMADLAPEIAKLKKKYAGNKQKFSQAQMDLFRKHGANPAAGCLPMILQFAILIALYQAFIQILKPNGAEVLTKINETVYPFLQLPAGTQIDLSFLYMDLSKPDLIHIGGIPVPGLFLLLAAATQFFSSKMMAPAAKVAKEEAAKTKEKKDDIMAMMQTQMVYLFPVMTLFIGYAFPSGLILYWFVFSVFQLGQQSFISGWGGLAPWKEKYLMRRA